jgi:hypothetical protein
VEGSSKQPDGCSGGPAWVTPAVHGWTHARVRDHAIAKRGATDEARSRTANWLVDLDFPNANPSATVDVDVGLALAARPEGEPRQSQRWIAQAQAKQVRARIRLMQGTARPRWR